MVHPPQTETAPTPAELEELETFAVAIARQTGLRLLERFGEQLKVEFKQEGNRSPVTEADREAEESLRSAIRVRYPDHSILGEEGENHEPGSSGYVWVLDPLDGTTNFINRFPLFCVSVGVLYERQPVAAAIFAVTSHQATPGVYHARRGGGAWFEDQPLTIPEQAEPGRARLAAQPSFFGRRPGAITPEFRPKQGEVRVMGSICQELAFVAAGVLQYALFFGPRIWDVAAGVLIVQEAGGLTLVSGPNRGAGWYNLVTFDPAPPDKPEDPDGELAGLVRWRRAMIIGTPGIAAYLAREVRMGPPPQTTAGRALARTLRALWRVVGR